MIFGRTNTRSIPKDQQINKTLFAVSREKEGYDMYQQERFKSARASTQNIFVFLYTKS